MRIMPAKGRPEPIRASRWAIARRLRRRVNMENPFNRRSTAYAAFNRTMRGLLKEQGVRRLRGLPARLQEIAYEFVMLTLWRAEDDVRRILRGSRSLTVVDADRHIAYSNTIARHATILGEAKKARGERTLADLFAEVAPHGNGAADASGPSRDERRGATLAKGGGL